MTYACPAEIAHDSLPHDLNDVLERFDIAWRRGTRPLIEAFLESTIACNHDLGDLARRKLLEELIKIDLEYGWRQPQSSSPERSQVGGGVSQALSATSLNRPRLEDYVARFPQIGPVEHLPLALIKEEYRVRKLWGDNPAHTEYAARFAALGSALSVALANADADLAAEHAPQGPAPLLRSSPQPCPKSPLVCPHCHHQFERGSDLLPDVLSCPSCGDVFTVDSTSLFSSQTEESPRVRVGRYELQEQIGTGAFGSVWLARDTQLGREVAVKLLRGGRWASPAEEERFLREARATAQLRHEGIVAVHDVGREGELIYLVADLVEGMSLAERLKQGPLPFPEGAKLIAYLADTLAYAHRQGVVHRDLKPSNIMLDGGGKDQPSSYSDRPKIMDFGLAKSDMEEITLTVDGQVLGTPAYMSPEQIRDPHHVDGRSDLFSLGVILYQLLTGELPFRGVTRMVLQQVQLDEPRPPRSLNDKVPYDLDTITLKCLAKEPAQRYATAEALALDVRRWLQGIPIQARPVGRLARFGRWCKRKPVLAGLSAALLLVAAAGFTGITWQWRIAEHNRKLAEDSQAQALANLEDANRLKVEAQNRARQEEQERQRIERDSKESRDAVFRALALQNEANLNPSARTAEANVEFLENLLKYNEGLLQQRPDDPGLRVMVATDYFRLGMTKGNQGRRAEAIEILQKSCALREKIIRDYPEFTYLQRNLAHVYKCVGIWQAQNNQWSLALASLEKSRALLERLLQSNLPDLSAVEDELASYYWQRGNILCHLGQLAAGLYTPEQARRVLETMLRNDSQAFFFAQGLAQSEHNRRAAPASWNGTVVGTMVALQPACCSLPANGTWIAATAEGLRSYERSRDLWRGLVQKHPNYVPYQSHLAVAWHNIGEVSYQLGQPEKALVAYEQALPYQRRAFALAPSMIQARVFIRWHYLNLAQIQRELGQPAVAAATILESKRYCEEDAAMLYRGACELARCIPMVSGGLTQFQHEEETQRRELAEKAVGMLRQAVAHGFRDRQRLQNDPHLGSLRAREDFMRLLTELQRETGSVAQDSISQPLP